MKKIVLPFVILFVSQIVDAQTKVSDLLCENLSNPVGLDAVQPRLSWKLISDKRNVMQTAYEIKVTSGKSAVWNSGKINSDSSVDVPYKGPSLRSGTKYYWKVRIWDNSG